MEILRKKKFIKDFIKLPVKLQEKLFEVLFLFETTPFHPSLANHLLKGKYNWFRSINLTWDYRVIFQELSDGNYELVELVRVWSHSELYK